MKTFDPLKQFFLYQTFWIRTECLNSEFLFSVLSRSLNEYGDLQAIINNPFKPKVATV